jgi:hypothetical protein
MSKKPLVIILVVLVILFLALTVYYWVTPADKVPDIIAGTFSGYHPGDKAVNFKHGLLTAILAIGCGILAWFKSGSKSSAK